MDPPSHRSESPSPCINSQPPVPANCRRGRSAGREVGPLRRCRRASLRREVVPRRRQPLIFRAFPPNESPSPPHCPSRILLLLPILLGRYGNLHRRPTEWPEQTWRSLLLLMGYERRTTILELTPSPSHGAEDGPLASTLATPHPAKEWPARPWRLPSIPIVEQSFRSEAPPLPPPPPTAVEDEGPREIDSCSTPPVYYYRDGRPVYFPFHPTTEEWAACEASADRELEDEMNHWI